MLGLASRIAHIGMFNLPAVILRLWDGLIMSVHARGIHFSEPSGQLNGRVSGALG